MFASWTCDISWHDIANRWWPTNSSCLRKSISWWDVSSLYWFSYFSFLFSCICPRCHAIVEVGCSQFISRGCQPLLLVMLFWTFCEATLSTSLHYADRCRRKVGHWDQHDLCKKQTIICFFKLMHSSKEFADTENFHTFGAFMLLVELTENLHQHSEKEAKLGITLEK